MKRNRIYCWLLLACIGGTIAYARPPILYKAIYLNSIRGITSTPTTNDTTITVTGALVPVGYRGIFAAEKQALGNARPVNATATHVMRRTNLPLGLPDRLWTSNLRITFGPVEIRKNDYAGIPLVVAGADSPYIMVHVVQSVDKVEIPKSGIPSNPIHGGNTVDIRAPLDATVDNYPNSSILTLGLPAISGIRGDINLKIVFDTSIMDVQESPAPSPAPAPPAAQ